MCSGSKISRLLISRFGLAMCEFESFTGQARGHVPAFLLAYSYVGLTEKWKLRLKRSQWYNSSKTGVRLHYIGLSLPGENAQRLLRPEPRVASCSIGDPLKPRQSKTISLKDAI